MDVYLPSHTNSLTYTEKVRLTLGGWCGGWEGVWIGAGERPGESHAIIQTYLILKAF